MNASEIKKYLEELNDELRAADVKGEVCMHGGAVMCLVYNACPATKDVNAVFVPVRHIRRAAGRIAEAHGLRKDWLNYAAKMFLVPHERNILIDFSHLKIYAPSPDYLLAMKTLAARPNTKDKDDIEFLIGELSLGSGAQVLDIVKEYYPHKQVSPATQILLEEIFGGRQ